MLIRHGYLFHCGICFKRHYQRRFHRALMDFIYPLSVDQSEESKTIIIREMLFSSRNVARRLVAWPPGRSCLE
jgi:hypothetical protein